MRKLIIISAIAVSLMSCATSKMTPADKAAAKAEQSRKVNELIDKRDFTIDVDYVYPKRAPAHPLSYGFSLEVHGDSIISYLPYFGRAYSIPYGGGKGLNFSARMSDCQVYRGKKDLTRMDIAVTNEEDTYIYKVEIYDNGSASIDVTARERESISFSGDMVIDDKK